MCQTLQVSQDNIQGYSPDTFADRNNGKCAFRIEIPKSVTNSPTLPYPKGCLVADLRECGEADSTFNDNRSASAGLNWRRRNGTERAFPEADSFRAESVQIRQQCCNRHVCAEWVSTGGRASEQFLGVGRCSSGCTPIACTCCTPLIPLP